MDNINNPNSKLSYEELLEQNTQLKNQVQEIEEKSKKVEDKNLYKEKYRHTIEKLNNSGSWELDLISNKQTWSENYCFLLGYDEKIDNPDEQLFLSHVYPEDLDKVKTAMQKSMEEQRPTELEFRYVPKDGTIRYARSKAEYIFDKQNNTTKIIGSFKDITEIKKSEVLLSDSEAKYRALYENAPLPYQSLDVDGNFIDINPRWLSTLGYKREEVIGKNYGDFLHPDWKNHFETNFPEFKRRGYVSDVQFKIRHKKGHYIDISFEGCIGTNPDGSFKQTYCVFKDITENKQIEEALNKNQFYLSKAQAMGKIGTWELDIINNKLVWTKENYKKFGVKYGTPLTYDVFINCIHPEDRDYVNSKWNAAIKGKPYDIEHRIISDGKVKWLREKAEVEFDENGKAVSAIGFTQDITKLKESEQTLKESEKQYKILFENIIDEIHYWKVIKDKNGEIKTWELVDANPSALKAWKKSKEQVIGKTVNEIFDNDTQKLFMPIVKKIFKTGKVYSWETFSPATKQYLSMDSIPLGEFFISTGRDITIRKKEEQELIKAKEKAEESENQLKYSQKVARIGYYVFNIQTGLWTSSEMLDEIFGINKNYIRDVQGWLNLIHPDFQQEMLNYLSVNILKNHETFNKSYQIINMKTGHPYWVEGLGTLEFDNDGNLLKMFGTIQDISTSKKFEQEIIIAKEKAEESEKQLRHISDNFVNGMIYQVAMLEENHRQFNYVSKNVEELYGCTVEEAKKDANLIYGKIHPDDIEGLIEKEKVALKKMSKFETEARTIAPNGNIRWAYYISKPRIINGIVCWDGIEVDITERKQMELELINAKEKAEESERLKSAFLANMSHEIRTPMNGILGFTTLLQDSNLSVENHKEYIDIIEKSGNRLLNTVNDIIEISKIESGEIKVTKSEVDLISYLDTLVTFFRPEAQKKNLEFIVQNNIDGNDFTITIDKNKLSSILSNLIKNAIKYTNEGTINVGFKIENNQVLFSCQDTGIGIPKSRQEAIFNRFEQADIEDKQAHQGSGLGLTIVKSYVEMLDGRVWVESEERKGSTFYVSLPYEPEKKKEQIIPQEVKSSDYGIKNINVLVVEDEEYSSMHLSILMKDKVKSIKTAENGIEAIDACKNDSGIDLILMDIKMPVMSGIEATKKIREFNKDVIIIAQTAYALEGDEGKALDAGCNDYISKPIDKNKLFELINKYF